MKGYKRVYCPFSASDTENVSGWLNEMAEDGWVLESRFLCFMTFRKAERTRGRYYILPNRNAYVTKEEIQQFEENGWRFITEFGSSGVFYSDDSFAHLPDFLKNRPAPKSASGLAVILLTLVTIGLDTYSYFGLRPWYEGFLHESAEYGFLYASLEYIIFAAALLVLFSSVRDYVRMKKGTKIIQNLFEKRPYSKLKRRLDRRVICFLGVLLLLAGATAVDSRIFAMEKNPDGALHPVLLSEVHPQYAEEVKKEPVYEHDAILQDDFPDRSYSFLSHSGIFFREYAKEEADLSDAIWDYVCIYGDARSEGIADRFLEEDMENVMKDLKAVSVKKLDIPGTDRASYLECSLGEYLWLQKGTRIEIVHMFADGMTLKDSIGLYAENLNR